MINLHDFLVDNKEEILRLTEAKSLGSLCQKPLRYKACIRTRTK